jgi:hypothetical protein
MDDHPLFFSCNLRKLPLRSIVALATRCARRVFPHSWPSAEEKEEAVDEALRAAEHFASENDDDIDGSAAHAKADAAMCFRVAGWAAKTYACSLVGAADAAVEAAERTIEAAETTASWSICDSCGANDEAGRDVAAAAATDYQRLLALSLGSFPELGRPIDLSEGGPLGPLWPGGVPWWVRLLRGDQVPELGP